MDGGVAIGHCTLSCLVIGGVYFALFVVSMLMLFALRNSYEIQNRNVTLLVFHNVTGLICAMAWMFGIGFRLWSCELSEILLQTSDFLCQY
ncbi:hypothetical protein M427DRAFT_373869 [Gonapodya prolifera JEL478]|uniref:Uncharacterized protein n=1 Tax=Gonapodya prolifera (strain JEL478) TaxID=1344416 RepID=A0A139AV50_GONPJ|nr:hypothetical protein M427DRAFT_373869 [Gonapodya prolifera JEL478]|eukprot:KXS20365.1 hypothetical protein M427DRAFT_373869 [Gonapodya prolifera JEL478]